MIILEVNRESVNSSEEFYQTTKESTKTEKVLLLIKDNQYSKYVVLPPKNWLISYRIFSRPN